MSDTVFIIAVTFIVSALVFYTIGVWGEKIQRKLKVWHVVLFWIGLSCDTTGTAAMGEIAGGMFQFNFHGITGMAAILIMLFHAIWGTLVLVRKDEKMILSFHKFSIVVWVIWLVPMLSGMIFGATV